MLRYTKKGIESKERIGTLPLRMSSLLRYRGVNTPEEAERFLHPRLTDLLDPSTMPGMEKAVSIIRQAVREQWGITIYGDYDVDGICATSIMLETLRDLGAQHVRPYIPSRHEEGYGLNADAIELLAKESRLLLTVDCGITNLDEVALAKKRGMTVIVTDHHQLAEKLPEADAVLNPLIEPYAFKRLCGAGVALKITQALLGMDGVEKRIDLAALATVADIVPLMEENRVIVREGMMRMGTSARPGLKKLMELAQVTQPVNTGHLGFRLAPRLNAGGRLETAEQCVKLLTTKDEAEATAIATHLNGLNQERQAMEKQIVEQAISAIPAQVNFRTDFAIVILGQEWNNGVIGLAAGRICEKYHFPTIVLSQHGDLAVGSCRSIPGVDIHQMLTACKALYQAEGHGQLFERFGGHSQAAGLTIRAELVPELRRLLNRVIPQGDNCDLTCYIPQREYELEVPLEAVNMALIDELNQLQPTGYGNPNPVLMARGLHVQEARRVGVGGAHLKLTLLDGANVRGGIGFQQGDLADHGYERVDVLFSPEVNEFRGQRTVQLNVAAMKQTGGSLLWPDEKMIFSALLQELTALASNYNTLSSGDAQAKILPLRTNQLREKLRLGRGVLMIAHQSAWAKDVLSGGEADTDVGQVRDARAFNTVLFAPDVEKLRDDWRDVVLLDGETLPGLKELIRQKCPNARLWCLSDAPDDLRKQLSAMTVSEDTLRGLYRRLLRGGTMAASALAQDCGMTEEQVLTGLTVFGQVALVSFKLDPYQLTLLPMHKVALTDSPLRKYLITHYAAETQM